MMDANGNDVLTVEVGGRLRELRQERGMSMRALARESGLSTNALSMIERGRTSPSVSTLCKIADALQIPITAFFRLEPPRQEIVLRRAKDRKRITFPKGLWEGLGGESFIGHMEPFMLTLEEGACSGPFGMIHTGHEFILCLSGKIEFEIENQKYMLEAGDNLIFAAQLTHRWCNGGETPATAIVVLAGFEQGESPSEFHLSSGLNRNKIADEEEFEDSKEEDYDENAEIEEI